MTDFNKKSVEVNRDFDNLLALLCRIHLADFTVTNEGNTAILKINGASLSICRDKTWQFEDGKTIGAGDFRKDMPYQEESPKAEEWKP